MGLPSWVAPLAAQAAIGFGMYELQKRDADTAQQRQVKDMAKAGRNPMWFGAGSGAAVPQQPSINVADAFRVGMERERQPLTILEQRATVQEILARAAQATNASARIADLKPLEVLLLKKDIEVKNLDVETKTAMLPFIAELARADIVSKLSSSRQSSALAFLEELKVNGALNESQWAEYIGMAGPIGRVLMDLARSLGTGAVAGALMRR